MKEKEMSLNLCVTCGFDYTYSLKILLLPVKLCTCACLGKKRYGSVGMKTQKGAMSKLNRAIPSSAVGAGFTCPNTQSKLFSGERTSPLQTKRQYYPHFDTTQAMGYISCYIQYNGYLLKT